MAPWRHELYASRGFHHPHECSSLFKQGIEKAEIGDFQSAITDFNQVLKINPSEAYCNRGQRELSLKIIKVPSQTLPRRCGFALTMLMPTTNGELYGLCWAIQGRWRNLTRCAKTPNFTDAYYNRGACLRTDRKPSGAIADYNQAIERNPLLAEAYGNRGFVHYRLGDKAEAIADLQKAAQLFSNQGDTAGYRQTLTYIHGSAAANGQTFHATMTPAARPRQMLKLQPV